METDLKRNENEYYEDRRSDIDRETKIIVCCYDHKEQYKDLCGMNKYLNWKVKVT